MNLRQQNGLIVQQEDTGSARRKSECKSRWVHLTQSCGLVAKAAPLQGDDRWFDSRRALFGPGTPTGRAARLKSGRLQVRLLLWATPRPGRQLADHSVSESEMLWVRIPPELLTKQHVLVEQPGVLACLSRRRSQVQILSGTLTGHGTQTGKAAKLKPW